MELGSRLLGAQSLLSDSSALTRGVDKCPWVKCGFMVRFHRAGGRIPGGTARWQAQTGGEHQDAGVLEGCYSERGKQAGDVKDTEKRTSKGPQTTPETGD